MDAFDGSFGVPRKVPAKDAPFLLSAGVGLTVVSLVIVAALLNDLGLTGEPASAPVAIIVLAGLFTGAPAAYYLGRWLQARNVSRLLGCGGLAVWALLLLTAALLAGWIGVVLMIVIPAVLMWRSTPRSADPFATLGRTPLPGSGYPGDSPRRWRPTLPALHGLRPQPVEPAAPVRRGRRWMPVAGNLLWVAAVVAWYFLSGSGAGSGGEGAASTAPIADSAGKVTFGTGIDKSDGSVTGEGSVFYPGDSFAWSVALTETTEASELSMRLSHVANNDKRVETAPIEVDAGPADVVWLDPEVPVTRDMIGFWMFEVLRGDEVLATGTFTVKAR